MLPVHLTETRKICKGDVVLLQVRSVQRGMTSLLEALVQHGLAVLPVARQPGSPADTPPSLMLLKDLLIQASLPPFGQNLSQAPNTTNAQYYCCTLS